MKPLSEMTAAEVDREYKAYDALNLAKNKLIRQAEELAEYGPLERYQPMLHAFANLAEAAWDNTMGSQFRPLFDALQAAEKREEEAAREAEEKDWPGPDHPHCQACNDGDCNWPHCPQLRDYKPRCPLARRSDDDD